jgi:hypothetical protein
VVERRVDAQVEQFSLTFRGPTERSPDEGMHRVRHAQLGEFDLFIAPVGGPPGERSTYEACFSRLTSQEDRTCPISS